MTGNLKKQTGPDVLPVIAVTRGTSCPCVIARVQKQRGAIIPLLSLAMVVMIGIAGLAIDSSHSFLTLSRMQNALDAAALSAAKTLNNSAGNTTLASAHGTEAFARHLLGEIDAQSITPQFEFASSLNPFTTSTVDARFVRVSVDDYPKTMWFSQILPGVDRQLLLDATAVAGPIPLGGGKVCDVAPMIVCGDAADTDSSDGTLFGLNYGNDATVQCLKSSRNNFGADDSSRMGTRNNGNGKGGGNNGNGGGNSAGDGDTSGNGNNGNGGNGNGNGNSGGSNSDIPPECEPPTDAIGPGNFQLIVLGCGNGANCVRESLAGESESCLFTDGSITTKPGNTVGPTAAGLNVRFGLYSSPLGPDEYPPDLVTAHPISYGQYQSAYFNQQFDQPDGIPERRVLAVPVGNCSVAGSGRTEIPILGFGCYFLTQPTQGSGQNNWIIGHLIEGCEVGGSPGEFPEKAGGGYSTYKIILYNDPDNLAS